MECARRTGIEAITSLKDGTVPFKGLTSEKSVETPRVPELAHGVLVRVTISGKGGT